MGLPDTAKIVVTEDFGRLSGPDGAVFMVSAFRKPAHPVLDTCFWLNTRAFPGGAVVVDAVRREPVSNPEFPV
jgi:hypothetical protein